MQIRCTCFRTRLFALDWVDYWDFLYPSWEVTLSQDGTEWFSSLHFNFDNDQLPDVDPEAMWDAKPDWLTAIVVFDILVANSDRHDRNIAVDDPLNPTVFKVFDHDQSLFGGLTHKPLGAARLEAVRNSLGITSATGGSRNDFVDQMTTDKYMPRWIKKIASIPDWMIDVCITSAAKYCIRAGDVDVVKIVSERQKAPT